MDPYTMDQMPVQAAYEALEKNRKLEDRLRILEREIEDLKARIDRLTVRLK